MQTWASAWQKQAASHPAPAVGSSIHQLGERVEQLQKERLRDYGAARILLVEDNVVNQKVALRMLSKLGLQADLAAHGREALEMLHLRRYDAVLMDCQMPEMNGYEATTQIRLREGSGRHTPIIALTAEAIVGCRERCLEAGMDDVITKPVTLVDLDRTLSLWLEPSPERAPAGSHLTAADPVGANAVDG
jgi:CheY-like chemotaxis protein